MRKTLIRIHRIDYRRLIHDTNSLVYFKEAEAGQHCKTNALQHQLVIAKNASSAYLNEDRKDDGAIR